ncbi:protein starmaker-like isoform X2 [Entelurus aequoreus]|nr:protein starmaker-like isoform X2 [Entelurus aequoreus]
MAHHNNNELLQQFDKAQDTLREMMTATAAMKTVRMEYEHHLEASAPCWQQQTKEDTQGHHTMAQQKHLLAESAHRPVLPPFLQHVIAPVSHPQCATRWASNQDDGPWSSVGMPSGSDGHLCMEDSPAHHAETCSSSGPSCQELDVPPARLASEQAEHVGSSTGSTEHVGSSSTGSTEHVGSSTGSTEHVGSSTGSTEHVGSSTGSTEHVGSSSTGSRRARTKKKGSTFAENRCNSQGSSRRSSAAVSGGQSSSVKGSTGTIRRNALGSPKMKNKRNDQESPTSSSLSKSPGEDAGSASPFNQSQSTREHSEWGSGSNKAVESKDHEEELDREEDSGEDEELDEETSQGDESEEDGDDLSDKVNKKDSVSSQEEEEQSEDNVEETDEEEEQREDNVEETDEEEEQRKDNVDETDEEEEQREDNVDETDEEEEQREDNVDETDEEEEQREDNVDETDEEQTSEEESDSDDSIIAPLQKRAEIPQEASDGREESTRRSDGREESTRRSDGREESTRRSDEDSTDVFDDNIENLLAPQTKKIEEKDVKAEEEHKGITETNIFIFVVDSYFLYLPATCNVKISPAETHQPSHSDDFDHFYD